MSSFVNLSVFFTEEVLSNLRRKFDVMFGEPNKFPIVKLSEGEVVIFVALLCTLLLLVYFHVLEIGGS